VTSNLVLVSGLTKLGNGEGESWVTLREDEAAAICAELSKLHAEHLQDVERMDRAATAMETYQAEIARLTAVETSDECEDADYLEQFIKDLPNKYHARHIAGIAERIRRTQKTSAEGQS
jgi:hypothetical protein